MKETFFSIIIPVYNTENFITETIDSVLKQKYQNYEIICVNDGSTDNSLNILNDLSQKDKRIKVIDIKNNGPANARNIGLKNSSGDYILFLDSDDLMQNNALKIINEKIQKNRNADVLIFSANAFNSIIIPDWVKESITTHNHSRAGYACYTAIFEEKTATPFIWNKVYNKNLLDSHNICFNTNITIGEDQAFLFRVFESANNIEFFSDTIYNYRWQRQDSLMSKFKKDKLETTKNHFNLIKDVLNNLYITNKLTVATDQLMQWLVSLLYNSHLKDLKIEEAAEIAFEFCDLLGFYYSVTNFKNCFHYEQWDVQNIFALSKIEYMATYKKSADIDLIIYENSNLNIENLKNFCDHQKDVNYRLVINCFSIGFYNYIQSQNIKNSIIVFLPNKTFSEAKNFSLKYSSSKYVLFINQKALLNEDLDLSKYISILNKNSQCSAITFDKISTHSNKELIHFNSLETIVNLGSTILNRSVVFDKNTNIKNDGPCSDAQFLIETLSNKTIMIFNDDVFVKPLNKETLWFSLDRYYSYDELCYSLGNLSISAIKFKHDKICKKLWNFIVTHQLINIHKVINVNSITVSSYVNQTYLLPLVEYMSANDTNLEDYKDYLNNVVKSLEEYDDNINSTLLEETKKLNNNLTPKMIATINKLKQTKIYKWWRAKKYGK